MFSKKNNEDIEDKKFGKFFTGFILYMIGVGLSVALVFRFMPYGYTLEIKEYFNFAGSFGGAILGAIVSFLILYVTVIRERSALEEQRKRFEKDYNIKIINDKLELYKEMYKMVDTIGYNITFIITELREGVNNSDVEKAYDIAIDTLREFRFHTIVNIDQNFFEDYKDLREVIYWFEDAINDYSHKKIDIIECKEKLTICRDILVKTERIITEKALELTEQKYSDK